MQSHKATVTPRRCVIGYVYKVVDLIRDSRLFVDLDLADIQNDVIKLTTQNVYFSVVRQFYIIVSDRL